MKFEANILLCGRFRRLTRKQGMEVLSFSQEDLGDQVLAQKFYLL